MNQQFDTSTQINKEKSLQPEPKQMAFNYSSSFRFASDNLQIIKSTSLSWDISSPKGEPMKKESDNDDDDGAVKVKEELIAPFENRNTNDNNSNHHALFMRNINITSFNISYLGHEGLSQSFMNEVKKMENDDMTESEFKELKTNLIEPLECANYINNNNTPLDRITENIDDNIQKDTKHNNDQIISEEKKANDETKTKVNQDKNSPIKVKVRKVSKEKGVSPNKITSRVTSLQNSPNKNESPQIGKIASKLKKIKSNLINNSSKTTINQSKKKKKEIQEIKESLQGIISKKNLKLKLQKENQLKSNSKEQKPSLSLNKDSNKKSKIDTIAKGNDKGESYYQYKTLKKKLKKKLKPICNDSSREIQELTSLREEMIKAKNDLIKNKLDQLKQKRKKSLPSTTQCLSKSKGNCPSSGDSLSKTIKKTMKKNLSFTGIQLPKGTVSGKVASQKESEAKLIQSPIRKETKMTNINSIKENIKGNRGININKKTTMNINKPLKHSETNPLLSIREHIKPNGFLGKVCEAIHNKVNITSFNTIITPKNNKGNYSNSLMIKKKIMNKKKKKMIDDCCQTSALYYPNNSYRLMSNITQNYFNNQMQYYKTIVSNPFSPYSSSYSLQKLNQRFNSKDNPKHQAQFPHFISPIDKVLYRNYSSSMFDLTSPKAMKNNHYESTPPLIVNNRSSSNSNSNTNNVNVNCGNLLIDSNNKDNIKYKSLLQFFKH